MLSGLSKTIAKLPIWIVPAYGVCVLAVVYIFEYGFGYLPCELCLWQRLPWIGIVIVGGLMMSYPQRIKQLLNICVLTMIVSLGLAIFHAGVEYGFWAGLDGCGGTTTLATDTKSLLDSLKTETAPRCDEPAWTLFGISMAGYNALLSLDALITFYLMKNRF